MRKLGTTMISIGLAAALVGCGGGGDDGPTFDDLGQLRTALEAEDLTCEAPEASTQEPDPEAEAQVLTMETMACTAGGSEVQASRYASATDREQVLATLDLAWCNDGLSGAFGAATDRVADGTWYLVAIDADGEHDVGLLDELADALDAPKQRADCERYG